MTIRQLPVSPSRDRPAQFSQEMDAMLAALPGFVNDANALEQSLQMVATTGTSASALTIGTGTKTLTTQPGKAWVTGAWVYVFCASAVTNLMVGQVTSYNSETGVLQINAQQVDGGGTFNSWVIGLSVPQVAWAKRGVNDDITALSSLTSTPQIIADQLSALVSALAERVRFSARTTQSSATGVAVDFTGVPSWAQRITLTLDQVSTNGSESVLVQLGTSASVQASAYVGSGSYIGPGLGSAQASNISTGFLLPLTNASSTRSGRLVLERVTGDVWVCVGFIGDGVSGNIISVAGRKSLGAALTRVRFTTPSAADTFDGGTISMVVEGW